MGQSPADPGQRDPNRGGLDPKAPAANLRESLRRVTGSLSLPVTRRRQPEGRALHRASLSVTSESDGAPGSPPV